MSERSNVLKEMADTLKQIQVSLEPVRDKALDETARSNGFVQCAESYIKTLIMEAERKGRMEGFASCAEQFLKVIVAKMEDLYKQSDELAKQEVSVKIQELTDKLEEVKKPEKEKKTK